jgi:leader peptidase (prepilin peptidase)/N-methyltransferase
LLEALVAGLFGLLIGSFLNVCIYRLPRDLSVVAPRSFCPACEHQIGWFDNVPIVSFVLLRGHCRHCRAKIPTRYLIVELLTGVLFFCAVLGLGLTLAAVKLCVFCAIMVELVFSDLEERILPDEFTLGGTVVGLVFAALLPTNGGLWRFLLPGIHNDRVLSVIEAAFASAFSSGTLWLVGAIYQKVRHREGLGLGDIKMVAMIGAFLGLQGVLLTLIVGSTLGAVIGLGYILLARKDAAHYELPFGSFLGATAVGVAFYGEFVVAWWSRLGT